MTDQPISPIRYYLLDQCWCCHRRLNTPLHCLQRRHLGMYRVHLDCFSDELFERFDTGYLVTVSKSDHVEERIPKTFYQERREATLALNRNDHGDG